MPVPAPPPQVQRPWLLLDVDGVLSPYGNRSGAWRDWRQAGNPDGFALPLSLELSRHVAALPLDRVWLTTWRHEANTVVAPFLGWPDVPVLDFAESGEQRSALPEKLAAAAAFLEANPRPFVWVDDDLASHPSASTWAARSGLPYLLLSPRSTVGLTLSQIRAVERWTRAPERAGLLR